MVPGDGHVVPLARREKAGAADARAALRPADGEAEPPVVRRSGQSPAIVVAAAGGHEAAAAALVAAAVDPLQFVDLEPAAQGEPGGRDIQRRSSHHAVEEARGTLPCEAPGSLGEGVLFGSGLEGQPSRHRPKAVPGQAIGTGAQAGLDRGLRRPRPDQLHRRGGNGRASQEYEQGDTAHAAGLTQIRVSHFLPPRSRDSPYLCRSGAGLPPPAQGAPRPHTLASSPLRTSAPMSEVISPGRSFREDRPRNCGRRRRLGSGTQASATPTPARQAAVERHGPVVALWLEPY